VRSTSAPDAGKSVRALAVGHAHHVLLDDRPGVELLGDVVRGRADDLHAALLRAAVGVGAGEGRQERVVDVDHRAADAGQEVAAEDLHVAGEDDEVELPPASSSSIRASAAGFSPLTTARAHSVRRSLDVGRVVGMVGDHERDLAVQLAAPPAPEEIEQAVVLARDEHRDALGAPRVVQAPLHREGLGHRVREGLREVLAERVGGEGHAHEERAALGIGRVLVGGDDVGVARGQEARDRRDDAVAVRAGDQQAGFHRPKTRRSAMFGSLMSFSAGGRGS
jgi:hypothetical protein